MILHTSSPRYLGPIIPLHVANWALSVILKAPQSETHMFTCFHILRRALVGSLCFPDLAGAVPPGLNGENKNFQTRKLLL